MVTSWRLAVNLLTICHETHILVCSHRHHVMKNATDRISRDSQGKSQRFSNRFLENRERFSEDSSRKICWENIRQLQCLLSHRMMMQRSPDSCRVLNLCRMLAHKTSREKKQEVEEPRASLHRFLMAESESCRSRAVLATKCNLNLALLMAKNE